MALHIRAFDIDYIEIYTPMAKLLAYWHTQALGFEIIAFCDGTDGPQKKSTISYVLKSNRICLVLTSTYSDKLMLPNYEVASWLGNNYYGVKRLALHVDSVEDSFTKSISGGAIPIKYPIKYQDDDGYIEEASIKLYDFNEILFVNRSSYKGIFKPGYKTYGKAGSKQDSHLFSIDHIASEVRVNECQYWTNYLSHCIGTNIAQSILRSEANNTGMILNINQSQDANLTLVIAEPDGAATGSKVQKNIDRFGAGIHHIAFTSEDLISTVEELSKKNVEFVRFPDSYYDLLRKEDDFKGVDIDKLQELGIIIDKENDAYLLQKFITPIGDRPFFMYEIVQRINQYKGFALKNINMLKRAEEMDVMNIK
jgi:4-hydroxyphenylpyruvate dioxygenase